LGDPDEEAEQWQELLGLEERVSQMLEASRPDVAPQARAEQRDHCLQPPAM
jgi:hypothetical protein